MTPFELLTVLIGTAGVLVLALRRIDPPAEPKEVPSPVPDAHVHHYRVVSRQVVDGQPTVTKRCLTCHKTIRDDDG